MFLFCLVFAMSLCLSVYMCFVVTCWERADLLALVCGVYSEFVTFPLVSWVRCGTWLYRFLIFAPLLTLLPTALRSLVKKKLEDMKVLRRSPDLSYYVKIGQGQLQLLIKHILFYHIWGLQPFWSSDFKQSNEYSIKQPSDIWETNVYIGM